ncbi:glutathione peroxidase [Candidatus Pelagibacter bacterium]|nr:glutathione peroxidase [Candidatus Pelagibacter bacterium]
MKKIKFFFLIFMFSFLTKVSANYSSLAYDFSFNGIDGNKIKLEDFKDKVIVIVNVASRCGYTPQYEDLQNLWSNYNEKGLVVIGIPTNNFKQEPGTNKEIKDFCETNFGINFPMTEKINVLGKDAHPFYKWAKQNHGLSAIPKWNFHKIIVGKNGKVVETFASFTKPSSNKFIKAIEKEIKN